MRNTKSNPARKTFGKTLTAGLDDVACGNCGKMLPRSLNYVLCPPCWNVYTTCKDAGVETLAELANPEKNREALMWRVASILRRSGVDDAEHLIRRLEHL